MHSRRVLIQILISSGNLQIVVLLPLLFLFFSFSRWRRHKNPHFLRALSPLLTGTRAKNNNNKNNNNNSKDGTFTLMSSPWVALAAKKEDPTLRPSSKDIRRQTPKNLPNETICVVDANAIVKGQNAITSKDQFKELVTTSEVISEIKDENARLRLQNDPNWLHLCVSEASEETVALVKQFARLTGDIGALSEPDIKVIALALTLEQEKCKGDLSHIRTEPPPPRKYRRKASKTAKPLPGWDFVSNAEDWKELDEMNAEMEKMEKNLVVGEDVSERFAKIALEKGKLLQRGLEAQSLVKDGAAADDDGEEAREEAPVANDDDDDGWEPAISRTTRVRRMKREQRNREREEEIEKERQRIAAETHQSAKEENEENEGVDENAGVSFFQSGPGEIPEGDDDDDTVGDDEKEEANNDDSFSQFTETSQILSEEQKQREEKRQNSLVSIVTADYSMQNVILQLGLKLFTPDGMRVKEVRRWVMRCHACETVTTNTQRVFCPKCGNNALERVEKFTGPDGAEHYGVRNKHILKGTKYSIPMPKSGRLGKKMEPILREDQLIGRKITKKERELNNISKKTEDVFTCEFSEDKYGEYKHVADAQKTIISIGGGNVKKNPNERKHVATNRRRK